MEEFKIDASGDPRTTGGSYRFVVVHTPPFPGESRPMVWRRSNGQTFHMAYRTREGAEGGRTRVLRGQPEWDAATVGVFDKHLGILV